MIIKEESSNALGTTFEFYVENNKIMAIYNSGKPVELTNLFKQHPECSKQFETLYQHILKKYPNYPYKKGSNDTVEDTHRDGKPSHTEVMISFINTYFYKNDKQLDFTILTGGTVKSNIEVEKSEIIKQAEKVYYPEVFEMMDFAIDYLKEAYSMKEEEFIDCINKVLKNKITDLEAWIETSEFRTYKEVQNNIDNLLDLYYKKYK